MPLAKGTKLTKRSPQLYRTRADGLHIDIQKKLLLDLECGKFDNNTLPSEIVESRTDWYGHPKKKAQAKLVTSVKDKIRRLRELKAKDPAEYW
mgnify:CR=1 FL=1